MLNYFPVVRKEFIFGRIVQLCNQFRSHLLSIKYDKLTNFFSIENKSEAWWGSRKCVTFMTAFSVVLFSLAHSLARSRFVWHDKKPASIQQQKHKILLWVCNENYMERRAIWHVTEQSRGLSLPDDWPSSSWVSFTFSLDHPFHPIHEVFRNVRSLALSLWPFSKIT